MVNAVEPKVSVITIVLNGAPFIERTLKSVVAQTYRNIEYIVLDGGSSDGTQEIVERYRESVSMFKSEPDRGISDAWNKGLAVCTGEIVALLNAGDEFYPDTVENALLSFNLGADVVYGDTELVDDRGRLLRFNAGRFHLWWYSGGIGFYHPSVLVRRSLYETVGGFETKLRYAMDTDWILRAVFSGAVMRYGRHRVRMVDGGVSVDNRFLANGEYLHCLRKHSGSDRLVYASMLMTSLRGLVRVLVRALRGPGRVGTDVQT